MYLALICHLFPVSVVMVTPCVEGSKATTYFDQAPRVPRSDEEQETLAPSGKTNLPSVRQVSSTSTPVAPAGACPRSIVAVPL